VQKTDAPHLVQASGACTILNRSARGAHTVGSVGPNKTTPATPTAPARWLMPESLPA
jgi:hypothetical protein